jgi:hypothetical protein
MVNTYIKGGVRIKTLAAERYDKIKSRVNFKFDMRKELTNANKRLIKKYSLEINELISRPYTWIKPLKNKKRNEILQKASGHSGRNPLIKGSFLPMSIDPSTGKRPKITFNKKNEVKITYEYVDKRLISFDMKALLENPRKEILRAVAHIDENKKTRFAIQTGAHMSTAKLMIKEEMIEKVIEWLFKYSVEEGVDEDDTAPNWLWGVYVFNFKNQDIVPKGWFAAERKKARDGYNKHNTKVKKGDL